CLLQAERGRLLAYLARTRSDESFSKMDWHDHSRSSKGAIQNTGRHRPTPEGSIPSASVCVESSVRFEASANLFEPFRFLVKGRGEAKLSPIVEQGSRLRRAPSAWVTSSIVGTSKGRLHESRNSRSVRHHNRGIVLEAL